MDVNELNVSEETLIDTNEPNQPNSEDPSQPNDTAEAFNKWAPVFGGDDPYSAIKLDSSFDFSFLGENIISSDMLDTLCLTVNY